MIALIILVLKIFGLLLGNSFNNKEKSIVGSEMNAKLLEAAVEYHGKELFNMILKQNNVEDAMMKSDETNEREEVDSVEWYFRFFGIFLFNKRD